MSSVFSLKPSYYEALKRLTLELAGINLGTDHTFLIESRLSTLARKEGFKSLNHLVDELFSEGQTRLAIQVVSALLERDTHFFPDKIGLDFLQNQLLQEMYQTREAGRALRILSFGCSSGQEPYSVAMIVDKARVKIPDCRVDIVGVDYPSPALDRARRGQYTHFEVQRGLPIRYLVDYFERREEDWVIKETLRSAVEYKDFHLLSNLEGLGLFDLILFRNSLPYYSMPAQIRVLRSLSSIVKPAGYLMLGSKESLPRASLGFDVLDTTPFALRKSASLLKDSAPEKTTPIIPPIPYKAMDRH